MPVTPQPTQETYYYKEVRKTPLGAGVVYEGYPIYHLYKRSLSGPDAREVTTNKTKTISSVSRVIFLSKIKPVTSVSRVISPSQIATITVGASHQYQTGDTVVVSGLTNTAYNGTHVLTAVGPTTISYANSGSVQASTVDVGTAAIGTKHATITVGAGHLFKIGEMVTVSGLTNTAYNGTHAIAAVDTTTISYLNSGSVQASTVDVGTASINIEYWLPLPNLTSYKEYNPGDENVPAERTKYEPRGLVGAGKTRRYYPDRFSIYTHKYYGTKLYVATDRTKPYPVSSTLLPSTNPYSYTNIQVWIESPQTYVNTYDNYGNLIVPSYWYHPFENRFYPFGNLETFGFTDSQYLIDSLFTRDTTGQSNESLMANAAASIRLAKIDELISRGITRDEAIALINANAAAVLTTRAANSLITPSARIAIRPPAATSVSVNVRGTSLARTLSTGSVTIATSLSPKIVQTTTSGQPKLEYTFRHRPNQITYSSIGSEWSPIDRAANRPMVDWKSYKLMSVTFSFIVAPDDNGSLDGAIDNGVITTSVDTELKTLRQMAMSPFPVVFMGFDKLLEEPVRYPFNNDAGKGSLFVIADFGVTSIYRSSTGAISRASCDMTLTEYPKELIKLVEFPKLKPMKFIPTGGSNERPLCDGNLGTPTFNVKVGLTVERLKALEKRGFITYNGKCSSVKVIPDFKDAYNYATMNPEVDLDDIKDTGGLKRP